MSWLAQAAGGTPPVAPRTTDDGYPKVDDPTIPNRKVSTKPANRPFLAYKEYRERQEALHNEWAERMKVREEKKARGEPVGPVEKDPTAEEEVGVLGLLKFLLYIVLFMLLAGKFFTGSFLWNYEEKLALVKTFWPRNELLFSEQRLAEFDGSDSNKPLYLAIDHDVYDVSSNPHTYGPGGSYHHMVGIDAARSFGTGCFREHRTHDLRGLSDSELASVKHWKKFFAEHKTYFKVGRVLHHPIDPASPIPAPCDVNRDSNQQKSPEKSVKQDPNRHVVHEEL